MATGYSEGKHNDPADTQDRLVRVGTKYQATAPTVVDGDNAYLLVDSAGRIIVTGPVASDGVSTGNPLSIGGDVDDTSPAAAAEGDRRVFRSTPEGNQIVELYKDNNALSPIAAMPGASEVKNDSKGINATSASRNTFFSPSSGKKIRLISIKVVSNGLTTDPDRVSVYFGTGAAYTTDGTKAVTEGSPGTTGSFSESWPDGAGPIGAADEALSWITETETETALRITCQFREE